MFSFDPKSRILKVQKIPEPELELNLLEYQRESYNMPMKLGINTMPLTRAGTVSICCKMGI